MGCKQCLLEALRVLDLFTVRHWARKDGACGERLAAETVTVVVFHEPLHVRADRNDLRRVNLGVDDEVVFLDFGEIGGVSETWDLEELLQIATDIWHLSHLGPRAFEVGIVDRIKAYEGHEEADVSFRDVISDHVALLA